MPKSVPPEWLARSPLLRSIAALDGFDKRRREYKRVGWLYAARNSCFADPVFKVGQTKVSPVVRVDRLSGSTSVYRPFQLVYWVHVSNRDLAEGFAHEILRESRVNPSKEFFNASVVEVARALDQAAAHYAIPLGRTPRAGFLPPDCHPARFDAPTAQSPTAFLPSSSRSVRRVDHATARSTPHPSPSDILPDRDI